MTKKKFFRFLKPIPPISFINAKTNLNIKFGHCTIIGRGGDLAPKFLEKAVFSSYFVYLVGFYNIIYNVSIKVK